MNNGQSDVTFELLRSLFSGQSGYRQKVQQEEWPCKICGTNNYMTRKACRQCKMHKKDLNVTPPPTKRTLQNTQAKPAVLAPWATREMVEEREASLSAALIAAKACAGCDGEVKSIEAKLEIVRKRTADPPSVHKNIDATRAFIGRAEKRHQDLVDEVTAMQEKEKAVFEELEDARKRLRTMEAEAREALAVPTPGHNCAEGLTDAVRTLLVTMHKHELSQEMREVVAAVTQQLPDEPLSEDFAEEPVEERGMHGTTRILPPDAMAELDLVDDEDEVALVEMARRLKRARRAAPY